MELTRIKLPYDEAAAKPILFGAMMDLAASVVHHFRSDFYHDALWIKEEMTLTNNAFFFYGVRESGTHLGGDEELLRKYSEHLYKITLTRSDRLTYWVATIEKV